MDTNGKKEVVLTVLSLLPNWAVVLWQHFISALPAFIQIMTAIYTCLLLIALLRDKYLPQRRHRRERK